MWRSEIAASSSFLGALLRDVALVLRKGVGARRIQRPGRSQVYVRLSANAMRIEEQLDDAEPQAVDVRADEQRLQNRLRKRPVLLLHPSPPAAIRSR